MFNVENNRYPKSAALFIFCKEILTIKNNKSNKVTDQEVGALLGFDPADCTHWKHGRKEIKSIHSIHKIANQLELDSRNLVDLVQGKKNLFDLLNDYKGYGGFSCSISERKMILDLANTMIGRVQIHSLPVQLSELAEMEPEVVFQMSDENLEADVMCTLKQNTWMITLPKQKQMGPALRFEAVQTFAKVILENKNTMSFMVGPNHVNLFSLFLLTPSHLLQQAYSQCDPARDLVDQLARNFWLSRTLINIRLKDFLTHRS